MPRDYWNMTGAFSLPVRAAVRTFIFVFSIVEIGLFAADIASLPSSASPTNQIVALVAAVLSTLTCAYHCLATVSSGAWYAWDFVQGVLWAAVAGVFGSLLFSEKKMDDERNGPLEPGRRSRLTAAVIFALCCLLLYVSSTVFGCAWCCAARRQRKAQEGVKEEHRLEESVPVDRRESRMQG